MAMTSFKPPDYSLYKNRLVKVLKGLKLRDGTDVLPGEICKIVDSLGKRVKLFRISDAKDFIIKIDQKGYFEVLPESDDASIKFRHVSE